MTAEGEIIETRKKVRKSSTGYDLTQIIAGGEGTLGIIVELTLRVFPLAKHRVGGLAAFPCAQDACEAVVALRKAGLGTIARIELCNATMIEATNKEFEMQALLTHSSTHSSIHEANATPP